MKRVYIATALTCLVILGAFIGIFRFLNLNEERTHLTVGFIYDNDESTAYTYNFSLARDALEKMYGSQVTIHTRSNVLDDRMEDPVRELAARGCDILFFNGYSDMVMELASEYPHIQFCQTSPMDMSGRSVPENYHTFKGEIYQGRYVSGIAAGMKLREMISEGIISEDQASIGFVAAFPTSESISGYTAFLLGARSVVPRTTMRVRYTGTWSSYALEKNAARQLIDEGCVILSLFTDTIGPAIACEEASVTRPVYFIGYSQSMRDVAPGTSLVATRICWEPYITAAVEALMTSRKIESAVRGHIHGNDVSAGFDRGWVEMVDLNQQLAAPGTEDAMNAAIEQFRRGKTDFVFRGEYTGVNPEDSSDTCDLRGGFTENADSSFPTFHYILSDVIILE